MKRSNSLILVILLICLFVVVSAKKPDKAKLSNKASYFTLNAKDTLSGDLTDLYPPERVGACGPLAFVADKKQADNGNLKFKGSSFTYKAKNEKQDADDLVVYSISDSCGNLYGPSSITLDIAASGAKGSSSFETGSVDETANEIESIEDTEEAQAAYRIIYKLDEERLQNIEPIFRYRADGTQKDVAFNLGTPGDPDRDGFFYVEGSPNRIKFCIEATAGSLRTYSFGWFTSKCVTTSVGNVNFEFGQTLEYKLSSATDGTAQIKFCVNPSGSSCSGTADVKGSISVRYNGVNPATCPSRITFENIATVYDGKVVNDGYGGLNWDPNPRVFNVFPWENNFEPSGLRQSASSDTKVAVVKNSVVINRPANAQFSLFSFYASSVCRDNLKIKVFCFASATSTTPTFTSSEVSLDAEFIIQRFDESPVFVNLMDNCKDMKKVQIKVVDDGDVDAKWPNGDRSSNSCEPWFTLDDLCVKTT